VKADLFKRLSILAGVAVLVIAFIMLFTYDIIKIDWVSFMKIQPAFQPMSDPLPVPADSIQIDGSAVGGTLDQYQPSASFKTATIATVTLSKTGSHTFHLVVSGKNSSSSGYKLSADKITLVKASNGGDGGGDDD